MSDTVNFPMTTRVFSREHWAVKRRSSTTNVLWLGTLAVAPMIFLEAFVPEGRRLFGKTLRFPIADAHYAMGFALLAQTTKENQFYERAVHFLEQLKKSRSPGFQHFCWGYPFDWVTRNGTIPADTPFITTLPYVYEAFEYVYRIDKDAHGSKVMRSMAEHARVDIRDFETSPGVRSCGYGPYDDTGGVINASAYRAFLLTSAAIQFSDDRYLKAAEGNINFVLSAQQPDGSWPYAVDGTRDFVDHFHTCFVLKALAKIEQLTGHEDVPEGNRTRSRILLRNISWMKTDCQSHFPIAPRLTVYRHELYDYAECINLCVLLRDRFSDLQRKLLNSAQRLS